MTDGLQKGDFMTLGTVQTTSAAGSYGLANTKSQAGWKNTDGSFAQKLGTGSKGAQSAQISHETSGSNHAAWQQKLSGSGIAAARAAEAIPSSATAAEQTAAAETAQTEDDGIFDYQKFFQEKINEIFVKVINGDTEPSYQIGSRSFTEKDWKKFLQKFDSVQDAIRKLMREEHAKREGKKLKYRQSSAVSKGAALAPGKSTVSETDQSSLLLADSTICVYPAAKETEDDIRYLTCYTKEGIFCRKMGQTQELAWSISFKDPQQYEKVMEWIGQFPKDWNLRFAAHENFWNDFLNGDIDTERFAEFMEGTNQGIPDYSMT